MTIYVYSNCFFIIIFLVFPKKEETSFNKETTSALKAILPVLIIIHHAFISIPAVGEIGAIVVATFFFVSGYGLEYKRIHHQNVMGVGRFRKLIVPIIYPAVLYLLCRFAFEGDVYGAIIDSLGKYQIIVPYSWFIITLIQLYFLYYLASYFHSTNIPFVMCFFITAYVVVLYALHVSSTYYCSVYGFFVGIIYNYIQPYITKSYKAVLCIASLMFVLSIIISILHLPFQRVFVTTLFSIGIILLTSSVSLKGKFVNFFSNISYELYLCQGIGFLVAKHLSGNNLIIFVITLLFTIIVSVLCNYLTKLTFNRFQTAT